MIRFATACVLSLGFVLPVWADDTPPASDDAAEAQADKPLAQRLKEQPDDKKLLDEYMIGNLTELRALLTADPDAAEKRLDEMDKLIGSLEAKTDAGKSLVGRAKAAVNFYRQQLVLARITLEDAVAALNENPDAANAVSNYRQKILGQIAPLTRSEPLKAEELLNAAKELLTSTKEKAKEDATKKAIEDAIKSLARYESSIAAGKKLLELIGSDAIPLNLDTWINGEPLTDADLKGKVVLLDFWAVWCGPCVSTFPHLKEWHEQYADKGLVIIGLTRYYGYKWDEQAGRAVRASGEEKPTPEVENDALLKFAESHELHHRISIQKDNSLSEHYAVTGIPHVVVIDRQGKVQLIRVGSGEANANAISETLAKLIAE